MIEIRTEQADDIEAIRQVNLEAFGQGPEAAIVDRLRENCPDVISFVALEYDRLVGHLFFSPVTRDEGKESVGLGLAPMAVLPERQRRGIGTELMHGALDILKAEKCPLVVVLGHPGYYPRFGFEPASKYGLACQWDGVPDEAFMALVLDESSVAGIEGVVRYRKEFDEAM